MLSQRSCRFVKVVSDSRHFKSGIIFAFSIDEYSIIMKIIMMQFEGPFKLHFRSFLYLCTCKFFGFKTPRAIIYHAVDQLHASYFWLFTIFKLCKRALFKCFSESLVKDYSSPEHNKQTERICYHLLFSFMQSTQTQTGI